MNTETLIRTESAYRTERAVRPATRRDVARLPRTLVRVLWHPRQVGTPVATAQRAGSIDEALRDTLATVDVNVDWQAGRA